MNRLQTWALAGILVVFTAFSVGYNVLQPIGEAPDETAHLGYVRFVQINRALPRASQDARPLDQPWNLTNEYSQAPLYYLLLAALLGPLNLPPEDGPHLNPFVTWQGHPWRLSIVLHRSDEGWPYQGLARFVHAGRLVSAMLALIALVATFAMLRTVTGDPNLALFGTAWLSLAPVYLLTSSRLTNDVGALAAGATTLFLCARLLVVRRPADPIALVATSVSLTAALLTKLDTAFLIPLVLVAGFYAAAPIEPIRAGVLRRLATALALLVLPIGSLAAWWIDYGSSAGATVGVKAGFGVLNPVTVISQLDGHNFLDAIWSWHATWWGGIGFGSLSPWPAPVYVTLAIPFTLLLGAGVLSLRKRTLHGQSVPNHRAIATLAILAVPIFYATIARASVPDVGLDSNARFTLPAAPVLILVVACGLRYLTRGGARLVVAGSYLGSIFLYDVTMALVWLPAIPNQPIPARLAPPDDVQVQAPLMRFANGVDLIAIDGIPASLAPSSQVSLKLTWIARSSPQRDFTAFVQIVNPATQTRIAAVDQIPFESTFPPRLWQDGEIVDESQTLLLPATFDPGRYVLLVGAYYNLGAGGIEPIGAQSATASGASIAIREWVVASASATWSPYTNIGAICLDSTKCTISASEGRRW
jgi:hypothetical protein